MKRYLESGECVDWRHPTILGRAATLRHDGSDEATAKACFEFVRDEVAHSWDHRRGPVTCRASEVLAHGTGYCYAKSHLLAALLRANGIPAGLCYQRVSVEDTGSPYCLHGLNAVYLERHGWYRVDARGNKVDVAAVFDPPIERLAYECHDPNERDLPEIWARPLPDVIDVLTRCETVEQVHENLPDVEVAGSRCERVRAGGHRTV